MKTFCFFVAVLLLSLPGYVHAEKLTLAHVAVNPSQGIFWVAKDSGILAKYGFTADIVLIPRHAANGAGFDCRRAELDQIGAPLF
jgi:hypothetical protein